METLLRDVKYGLRSLVRNPGFSLLVVATLAVGIGANAAIISLINATMIHQLPFRDPDQVVVVFETTTKDKVQRRMVSYPDYLDWIRQQNVFTDIAAAYSETFNLTVGEKAMRIEIGLVTHNFLTVFGAQPALGRDLTAEETEPPGGAPVAVLSHGFWQRQFGGDPEALGKTLEINGVQFTVVGIMPEEFKGLAGEMELWVPISMITQLDASVPENVFDLRGGRFMWTVARLKPGVSIDAASREMEVIAQRLAKEYPVTNTDYGTLITPVEKILVGSVQTASVLFLGLVLFVLALVCANVATLLSARMMARRKEIAVRSAIGGSRIQVVRQLVVETLILALVGWALGLLLGRWGLSFLVSVNPLDLPTYLDFEVDPLVALLTLAIAVVVGLLLGLVPALRALKVDLTRSLKDTREASPALLGLRRLRGQNLLVAVQLSAAVVLLIAAGLMQKSFKKQQALDTGFRVENTLTMQLQLPISKYTAETAAVFSRNIRERIDALPGVETAAIVSDIPMRGGHRAGSVQVEDHLVDPDSPPVRVVYHHISPEFFDAMGIRLLSGRAFRETDSQGAPGVVIVSKQMADSTWPGEDPVGKRIRRGSGQGPWFTVVGMVGDVRYNDLVPSESRANSPDIYFPFFQVFQALSLNMGLVVHSSTEPKALMPHLQEAVREVDPTLPLYDVRTMKSIVASQSALNRFGSILISFLGGIAILIAALGIYAVMSFSIAQRTREIGIRMALGARRWQVVSSVLKEGLGVTLIGLVLGVLLALGVTRFLRALLYEVSASDVATYTAVSAMLLAVAVVACVLPARRSIRIDPAKALRDS